MSNSYQPIYDAVRSRIGNVDIRSAVESVARDAFDIGHIKRMVRQDVAIALEEWIRPSVLFRPSIGLDGNKWRALYGANLMEGIVGFGDTPDAAMRDFDQRWFTERAPTPTPSR